VAKVRLLDPTDAKRRLDRYELIGELASGGMATVFLGRLAGVGGFQRFVAIKRLHPHLASEEEFIEMFLDEARLAAGIHHPHVVPILEIGESDSGYYLVMEYIEGDTLARLMARSLARAQPIPRGVLIRIVLDALAGLHAAHELVDPSGNPVHLVHRDVSPQNVLVGVDGCSRITDFGVAHASSRLQNTRADRLKGKLAYMSPEQARAGDVDQRADVFAMGIILWEVLAAKRLFKSESEAITLQRVTSEPIPRLSAVVPGAHPALEQVCMKALERDPDRRYRTAADMAEALERAARAAASASATDLGVASPREVAAYVQGALGEDIAAQRESVRAWLAHSEPSLPRLSGQKPGEGHRPALRPGYDVTVKVPLDLPVPGLEGRAPTWAPPPNPRAPAPRADAGVREALGMAHADGAQLDETPVEPVADDDDDHETLLMDRDTQAAELLALVTRKRAAPTMQERGSASGPAIHHGVHHGGGHHGGQGGNTGGAAHRSAQPASPRNLPFPEDGTPSKSIESSFMVPASPPPNRTPQLVALVVAVVIAACGFVLWWQLSGDPVSPSVPAPTPGSSGPATPPSATPAPAPTPSETTATAATPVSALPTVPPARVKGPMPHGKTAAAPVVSATPVAAPVAPPPPEKPPEDMANPYRPQ
jgi:eukaryotic-like serine/threonine-protein kinase